MICSTNTITSTWTRVFFFSQICTCNLSRLSSNIVHLDFQLNVWIISVGFTLGFGALFSKTFRVHILFTQGTVKKVRLLVECYPFINAKNNNIFPKLVFTTGIKLIAHFYRLSIFLLFF